MEGDPRNPRLSLLKKYDIPIDHLSYEYVGNCTNKKDLERIVRILRSGEEGSYPDLLKVAEERLRLFAPESRVLRVETPVLTKERLTQEEWGAVEKELLSWEEEMKIMDKSLDFEKTRIETVGNKSMPGVRKTVQPKLKNKKVNAVTGNKSTRIKSGDYAAWDKFDVDKELLKISVEEEREQEENERKQREAQKLQKKKVIEIMDVDKGNYSLMEQQVLASQAKDRGNECYKFGDLESALNYYKISIQLHPTAHAYNNRAATYLKLRQYESAIEDCNRVLQMEKKNIKALFRRATAYQNLASSKETNNYDHLALQDLYEIVYIEPNNKVAQADLQKLKKKLNIEDVGKKFRMHISEEVEKKENCKEVEGKDISVTDNNTSVEKVPLTYYGPSTSSFQCEPHSMLHRALSGSSVSGQVLCKCNSNRPRQNPLCQKCGEAMCTPKPNKVVKAPSDAKPVPKKDNEVKIQLPKSQANETSLKVEVCSSDLSNEKRDQIANDNFVASNSESGGVAEKGNLHPVGLKNKTDSDDNNNHHLGFIGGGDVDISSTKVSGKQENPVEKAIVRDRTVPTSDKTNKEIIARKCKEITGNEVLRPVADHRKSSIIDVLKEVESICFSDSGAVVTENSSNQDDNIQNLEKSKHKKKKSKEHKENKVTRKHQHDMNGTKTTKRDEPLKVEPVKVVHAAKYLHPTSVEPKVKNETSVECQRETNISGTIHYKAFVPSRKCYSSECNKISLSTAVVQPSTSKKISKEVSNSYSSLEGNKENISECQCSSNNENGGMEDGAEQAKREVIDSAYEFMKKWEELKKLDESYKKRAEVIRKIRPIDLGKVIGIKLDSDMLSCLLECLLRHFIETDPKRVIELLNQLPKVPRYGLVSMFLAETDKKKMKKLIDTAEDKGFKLDEDVKKNLNLHS